MNVILTWMDACVVGLLTETHCPFSRWETDESGKETVANCTPASVICWFTSVKVTFWTQYSVPWKLASYVLEEVLGGAQGLAVTEVDDLFSLSTSDLSLST